MVAITQDGLPGLELFASWCSQWVLCFLCYGASEGYISELRWAECLIFTSFHPFSSHLHAAIKESSLVCIVL